MKMNIMKHSRKVPDNSFKLLFKRKISLETYEERKKKKENYNINKAKKIVCMKLFLFLFGC